MKLHVCYHSNEWSQHPNTWNPQLVLQLLITTCRYKCLTSSIPAIIARRQVRLIIQCFLILEGHKVILLDESAYFFSLVLPDFQLVAKHFIISRGCCTRVITTLNCQISNSLLNSKINIRCGIGAQVGAFHIGVRVFRAKSKLYLYHGSHQRSWETGLGASRKLFFFLLSY